MKKLDLAYENLVHEISGTVARYFAPVIGIYDGIEKALSIPTTWPHHHKEGEAIKQDLRG